MYIQTQYLYQVGGQVHTVIISGFRIHLYIYSRHLCMSRKKLLDHSDQSELQITFSADRIRGLTWQ